MQTETVAYNDYPCEIHSYRCTEIVHKHHNPPISWWENAGKPFRGVIHYLCPTAHEGRLHYWIDLMIRNDLHYPPGVNKKMRDMLDECFTLAYDFHLIPTPTL